MPHQRQPECREGEGPTCGKPTGFNTGVSNTYVIFCAAKLGLVKRETLMLSWQRRLATGSWLQVDPAEGKSPAACAQAAQIGIISIVVQRQWVIGLHLHD